MVLKRLLKEAVQSVLSDPSVLGALATPRPLRTHNLDAETILAEQRWGGFVVVPAANIDVAVGMVRDGIHEAWTTRLVQELLRPGHNFVNVGANFGYYVSLGGRIVGHTGRVLAIEANPYVLPYLMKTIYWSSISDRVEVFNAAAGTEDGGTVNFAFDYQFMGGGGVDRSESVASDEAGRYWAAQTVPKLLDADRRWVKGRGLFNTFRAHWRTLDTICDNLPMAHLIHMDIEGSEPAAIAGAHKLISRSPELRIITEWSGGYYQNADAAGRAIIEAMWDFLTNQEGFRPRHLVPSVAPDGGISVTEPMTFEELLKAPHGDYVWSRPTNDPWSR